MSLISSQEAFKAIIDGSVNLIDVRSEGEFAKGHIPGAVNIPILNDENRHLVGTEYKKNGQQAAIELGNKLVLPIKAQLLEQWQKVFHKNVLVYCWRGGLRSKISCQWMAEAGLSPIRIEGGYKEMRQVVLETFSKPGDLVVLSGHTGSRKTALLRGLPGNFVLDLEGLANHKGSAFGFMGEEPQPRQQNFENAMALNLLGSTYEKFVEDESQTIGSNFVPLEFREKTLAAPHVVVKESAEVRAQGIFQDYILKPLEQFSAEEVLGMVHHSLNKIERKLGGKLCQELKEKATEAFSKNPHTVESHKQWILPLLTHYYDPMYSFAFDRKKPRVIFEGTWDEVKTWIGKRIESYQHEKTS